MKIILIGAACLLAACTTSRWEEAHQACRGDMACHNLIEAKEAASTQAPTSAAEQSQLRQESAELSVVPLPRPPSLCSSRVEDNFPTTRCY
jgi:hypothetical protein